MKYRFYTMEYMIYRRKYSNEKKNHYKNLQEKIPTKKTKMNKFSQQKPLNIPSEILHNHEELEHDESQSVKTTEGSRITVEVGGEKSNRDFETETNHSLVSEYVTQPWLKMGDMITAVCVTNHFEKIQKLSDPVPGCPNFRKAARYKVYCCGQPTIAGFEAAPNKVRVEIYPKVGKIIWLNLRQEPDIYGHKRMTMIKYETFNMPVKHNAIPTVPYLYASERTTNIIINSEDGAPRPVQVYEKAALSNIVHIDPAGHRVTKSLMKTHTEGGYVCTTIVEHKNAQDVGEKPYNVAVDLEQDMSTAIACNSLDKFYELPAGQPSFHNLAVCGVLYPGNADNILDKIKNIVRAGKRVISE